jgi:hypothetical protein
MRFEPTPPNYIGVIASGAVFQAEKGACPERSRRDLTLNRPSRKPKFTSWNFTNSYPTITGVASIKLFVYACTGRSVICSASPISTIFPRYITAIRVER